LLDDQVVTNTIREFSSSSGVTRGDKWEHAPRGAGLAGASVHFLQSFKNAF